MYDESTRATLRTSCERCRTQKLRCISSPNSADGAPCVRCVKAKLSDSCVFYTRSKTGRGAGRTRKLSDTGESSPTKNKETPSSSLPGMSTFTLAGVSPTAAEWASPDHLTALPTADSLHMLDLDDSSLNRATVSTESSISDIWQDKTTLDTFSLEEFLNQSPALLPSSDKSVSTDDTGICPQKNDIMDDIGMLFPMGHAIHSEIQVLAPSPSDIAPIGHPELDMFSENRPDALMDFIVLLTEMSSYEGRISKLSGSTFHDYPIGDAIFISHRFYDILDNNRNPSVDSISRMSTPTFLLSVSCFINLTRIYSAFFDHLREYILQMPEVQPTQHFADLAHHPLGTDIHLYRGLKLRQLQPICLCSSWDPMKKAVSMLLSTLRSTEGLLGLPLDLRIADPSGIEGQILQTSGTDTEKKALAEEESVDLLYRGSLYKTVEKQAMQLRWKIKAAHKLLKEPCKHRSSVLPDFRSI